MTGAADAAVHPTNLSPGDRVVGCRGQVWVDQLHDDAARLRGLLGGVGDPWVAQMVADVQVGTAGGQDR